MKPGERCAQGTTETTLQEHLGDVWFTPINWCNHKLADTIHP